MYCCTGPQLCCLGGLCTVTLLLFPSKLEYMSRVKCMYIPTCADELYTFVTMNICKYLYMPVVTMNNYIHCISVSCENV